MVECSSFQPQCEGSADLLWDTSSPSLLKSTLPSSPCLTLAHTSGPGVNLFECEPTEKNGKWVFSPGAAPTTVESEYQTGACLTYESGPNPTPVDVDVDVDGMGVVFEGVGGLAAVGGARLLFDYPEPLRGELIELLFAETNGAAYQLLKTEIMGDIDSSYGSGPAFKHSATDTPDFNRSIYLTWLIPEAKCARPSVSLYALSWGLPEYVGNLLTPAGVEFHIEYLQGARAHHNITWNTIGIWNEADWSMEYVLALRAALDSAGFKTMDIAVPDGAGGSCTDCPAGADNIFTAIVANSTFANAVDIVGIHTDGFSSPSPALPSHIRLWNSENNEIDGPVPQWVPIRKEGGEVGGFGYFSVLCFILPSSPFLLYFQQPTSPFLLLLILIAAEDDSFGSGLNWPRTHLLNLIAANATCTILCPMTHSFSWNYGRENHGHSYFMEPWSGHYELSSPFFTQAHVTQFTRVGWRVLHDASGMVGMNVVYATLVSPDGKDWSFIVVNVDPVESTKFHLTFAPSTPLPSQLSQVSSNASHYFHPLPSIAPNKQLGNNFTIPPRSIFTLSSLQSYGFHLPTNPRRTPFPFPYKSSFSSQAHGEPGKYLSDLYGAFTIVNGRLMQGAVAQGSSFHGRIGLPFTSLPYGANIANVNASVLVETNNTARICVRVPVFSPSAVKTLDYSLGVCLSLTTSTSTFLLTEAIDGSGVKTLSSGSSPSSPSSTALLRIVAQGTSVQAFINEKQVASLPNSLTLLSGTTALGSDYNPCFFDDFQVSAAVSAAPVDPNNLVYDLVVGTTLHTNISDYAGVVITPRTKNLKVSRLGRFIAPGNKMTHQLQIFDPTSNTFLLTNPPSIDLSSCKANILNICHANLSTPIPLQQNQLYYLLSSEASNSDSVIEMVNPAANTNHINRDGTTLMLHHQDVSIRGRVWGTPGSFSTILELDSSFGPVDATFL